MGQLKPIPRQLWIKFLKQEGLYRKRTTASHEIWDYPDTSLHRPVVFRTTDRDIPRLHMKKCLDTLGIEVDEFPESKICEVSGTADYCFQGPSLSILLSSARNASNVVPTTYRYGK